MTFNQILDKYRKEARNQREKGDKFERLMVGFLQTDPIYTSLFKSVCLWKDFIGRHDLGGGDSGIDLVAVTHEGDYWAIQCKCFQDGTTLDKGALDSFLSTSSRSFKGEDHKMTKFAYRLWISTSSHWGINASKAVENQHPPFKRLTLSDLRFSPVDWEKLENDIHGEAARTKKKSLRPHQFSAMNSTHEYFKTNDRGKLIMACGTGKTFNSLRIAENETNGKGLVLFLVPSIALLGQTLREWMSDAEQDFNAVCICSDAEITKQKTKNDDTPTDNIIDLAWPASTNVKSVVDQFKYFEANNRKGMTVVFSTYQSIEVISRAQTELLKQGFSEFDLIICDEAHRTTGVSLAGEDESAFTKVHNNDFIRAKKRLYMTATPRLYSDDSKSKAAQADAVLCSMDDVSLYGEEIYRIGFGEAVERGLLADYKVLILTLNDGDVPQSIQKMISDENNEITADDATRLIGCVNALSKQIIGDNGVLETNDPEPMKRAVAFCPRIVDSKKIKDIFNVATDAYISSLPSDKKDQMVQVAAKHIDGTMSAPDRDELLTWLKEEIPTGECRILTNVRCLSEGVDVPSLDAVMFLAARNSQVDVVQSVGRVMRKAPGTSKKYGYIIIPVVVPSNVEADKALDDNERYKVVWTVLNALRAHDDRFNAIVNKIELNKQRPEQIIIGRPEFKFEGSTTVPFDSQSQNKAAAEMSRQLSLQFEELQRVVFARMVNKVGDRRYWEQWAKSVAEIAERQVERITRLIADDKTHQQAFANFLAGLQKNINPSITQQEAVEMLSQHIITKPVFEALFEGYSFVKNNPISVSMQTMLDLLEAQAVEKDTETLQKFYESVKMRASGIDNAEGKQRIIIELYDKFFKTAFPKMVEKLGIVYTPVEVVDFIIHSVNDVLKKEFGRSLSDENVNILDPFTGTGTFITRLLQSGLIEQKDLERKYRKEVFANEIVLLAYYIAAVNIENAFHDATLDPDDGIGKEKYIPFEGICLTDTFQLGEKDSSERLIKEMFPQNSKRVQRQKDTPLTVIFGNPPYSVGQKSANDNAQNQKYENLDRRIADTYANATRATNKNSLYDSYIKAFRWSSDRVAKNGGVVCFVSNGSWIDGNAQDGLRKELEREFSSIYVFNLRGNQRTSGEMSRREGGKIFGSGSRTPIAIILLVKSDAGAKEKATIHYRDIGDYLSREDKLQLVRKLKSVANPEMEWQTLQPNEHGDWVNYRNESFANYIPLGDKSADKAASFFVPIFSNGVKTNRDAWSYNSSREALEKNITKTIDHFNSQVEAFKEARKASPTLKPEEFIKPDSTQMSWDYGQRVDLGKLIKYSFDSESIRQALYRPFFKQNLYFNRSLINRMYQMPKLFPKASHENLLICTTGEGNLGFSMLMAKMTPDLCITKTGNGGSQCYPLYYYEERERQNPSLFDVPGKSEYIKRDGVSDFILERARSMYGNTIGKEDIFYYVYGFLHSPEYREKFANDLKKMLPRLPLVEDVRDFWIFSRLGRRLANLHINYEKVPPYEGVKVTGDESEFYTVEKMRFPSKGQKDTILYNSKITVSNIPAKAYEYVVNGKSAIEWIMERYQVTTHKESGIRNNPNDWADEVQKPRYILDLLLSIINVSVQTVDIVEQLPKVKFE